MNSDDDVRQKTGSTHGMASEQTPTGPCPDCGTEIRIDAPDEGGCPACGYTHPDAGRELEVGETAVDEPEWRGTRCLDCALETGSDAPIEVV